MPNPRYIKDGKPTEELEFKLKMAHYVYFSKLEPFCKDYGYEHELENLRNIQRVYLVGSHAHETKWDNDKSDIDFLFLISPMLPDAFKEFKKKILDDKLHMGRKPDWIDIWAENELYKIDPPNLEITDLWKAINQEF